MSKFSNLYDIDGNIINMAPQHRFTIEETEELVDRLSKKVEENPDSKVYKVYLSNAQKWLFKLYNEMDRAELLKRMSFTQEAIQKAKDEVSEAEQVKMEEINTAIEELKKEYDKISEDPVVMDEYVEPIELEDEKNREDIHTLHSEQPETDTSATSE